MQQAVVSPKLQQQLQVVLEKKQTPSAWLYRQFAEQGMVLLHNQQNLLPLQDLTTTPFYWLAVADSLAGETNDFGNFFAKQPTQFADFEETIQLYTTAIKPLTVDDLLTFQQKLGVKASKNKTKNKNLSDTFEVSDKSKSFRSIWLVAAKGCLSADSMQQANYHAALVRLDSAAQSLQAAIVWVHLGKAATLPAYQDFKSFWAVLLLHQNNATTQSIAAQAIFGAISPKGRWQGFGLDMPLLSRLKYTLPEEVGLHTDNLPRLDSLLIAAIRQRAMPSCQVLIAKEGKVFYHKTFGYFRYDSLQPVHLHSLYDLASITKIAAGTLSIMKLVENKQLNLDKKLADYLPEWKRTNKTAITLRELFAHQSRLPAGINGWQQTLTQNGKPNPAYYSRVAKAPFLSQVADSLFANEQKMEKLVATAIQKTALLPQKGLLYSDLPFVISSWLVKKVAKQTIATFASKNFYQPLGANSLCFNPLQQFSKQEIVPTEYDSVFRKQQIQGTVHDETAALLGGISGNAGLFGNANDLAKLMQCYLQKGYYGGKTYLQAETLLNFTRNQYGWEKQGNYRGLGFNRPAMNPNPSGHTAVAVSEQSFGHSGFTGTYTWADAENGLLFVFLSNRVYPTRENKLLLTTNLRTNLLQKIYEWLER